MTKPTFDTHLLGIIVDTETFAPWLTWLDRQTGEGTRVAEMLPTDGQYISPEKAAAREAELARVLGYPVAEARDLYKRSRADPDYGRVVALWNERKRLKAREEANPHVVIEKD